MKVAVAGSRSFSDYHLLASCLQQLPHIRLIISGGAVGADQLAERWANRQGIKTLIFRPDWEKYGKSAGVIRNREIVAHADMLVAFWDGESKGTGYTIEFARQNGLDVQTVLFKNSR